MSRSTSLPPWFRPMQPALSRPFHRRGWVYEEKVDGWRILAFKEGRHVRLLSRTARDHAERFVDVARAIVELPARTLVLDGEVAVFDERLVSRFDLLADPGAALVTPPVYIVFDVLWIGGRDLRRAPLSDRRRELETVIAGASLVYPARRLVDDGLEAFADMKRRGCEGLVAKAEPSPYVAGGTSLWRKVKVRREGRFVVVGLELTHDGRPRVLLARRAGRGIRYVGGVQWGLTRGALGELLKHAVRRPDPPCAIDHRGRRVAWCEPRMDVEITYAEIMRGELRDPVFRAIVSP